MNKKEKSAVAAHSNNLLIFVAASLSILAFVFSVEAQSATDRKKYDKAMAMYNEYTRSFPEVADIPSEEAIPLLSDQDVVFVDIRRAKEQKVSMIPGAVTKKAFLKNLEKYQGKRVIAYCTISYRSGKFAEKMEKKGLSVTNLRGGLIGWVHANGPLTKGDQPTTNLHVYGRKWDLVPESINPVY